MTGLKAFRLVPFCLLLLAGNVLAVVSDNGSVNNLQAERVRAAAAKAADAEGVDDLLSDLKSNNFSSVSKNDTSNYVRTIQHAILNNAGGIFDNYKGKQCILRIHLSRDGSLSGVNIEGGAPDLCNEVLDIMHGIKKFPPPPSEVVYQKIKDSKLSFKP
ncbi:TPA: cell envelope integrity TolA C-terminal domain-containing protein [Salmonella enterica subsp. enterica serovar Newport]|uniref:cell envelope integrity TolA C-terminal domain-containing protein n=1 Tax=Salmonella sp. SAL04162 TaxID=3159782 RepID=UPI002A22DEBE|nr:hypothetical protein [Salmonella enterica]